MNKPALRTPKILFVFSETESEASTRYGGFVRRLKKHGLDFADVDYVALDQLVFWVQDPDHARVYDYKKGVDPKDYAFVYFKSWLNRSEEASALAAYLEAHGVPYMDTQVYEKDKWKLPIQFKLWSSKKPVPAFWYGPRQAIDEVLDDGAGFGYPIVLKSLDGQKGQDNYLCQDKDEVRQHLASSPDVNFMLQQYVPNEGDYRIGIYGAKARMAMLRKGSPGGYLNNTSTGGSAEWLEMADVPEDLLELAEASAAAIKLQVAGVDIIVDQQTQQTYVLEVNQGSQIVTGAHVDKKIATFNAFLGDVVGRRYKRQKPKRLDVLGRHATITFPSLGLKNLTAKVDTGAYTSSLHADGVEEFEEGGKKRLRFRIIDDHRSDSASGIGSFVVDEYHERWVKSSIGEVQSRYTVRLPVVIGGRNLGVDFTLSSRSEMKYPVLLGRRVLRGRFLVNVELSQDRRGDES